ncbi:hypothetical protein [Campylobacter ureolyticus]|uniref:hypothetical protein n=1 Tax=Campylobacter ureolyticus TaxID=827 RepID=UPI0022B4EF96|nr:hypothetical protein [Campylobacter ureolyticus]MCZ6116287.1 hypothetical protein [Campylobacter ureolyticus]
MDDDKREKLREYLRNNRPKNNINLGNSFNNKENSNKNLEDNSNLNNSQISNNKTNSIKRDYDKEPIIIKDYSISMATHLIMCGILWFIVFFALSVFVAQFDYKDESRNFHALFVVIFTYIVFFITDIYLFSIFNSSKRFVILYNSYAIFYKENKIKKEFFLKGKNIGVNSFFHMVKFVFRVFWPLCVLIVFVGMIESVKEGFYAIFIIFAPVTLAISYDFLFRRMIYKQINGNLNGFYENWLKIYIEIGWFRPGIHIRKGISLFFFNEKDYKDLKEYIQIVFDKNLDKDIKSISE